MPFYGGSPEERIAAKIAYSKETPELAVGPTLLGKRVRWLPHGHGPDETKECEKNEAIIVEISLSDRYCLWVSVGTPLYGVVCASCAEPTTFTADQLEFLELL